MRKVTGVVLGFVASFVLSASAAQAGTVDLTFVNNPYGIVGPYIGTIDGKIADIICDDFLSDTYDGEAWKANVSTLADVSGTKFQNLQGYQEVAWLAMHLVDPSYASQRTAIQFAMWEVFASPAPFNYLGAGSAQAAAQSWLNQASLFVQSSGYNQANFIDNFRIYTAIGTPTCNGGPCPSSAPTPQEFVTYVPEAGTFELLALSLLAALAYWRYRRSSVEMPALEIA